MGGSVEEASSTLVKQKRSQQLGSSTSRRPFLQRQPDAVAPPAPRTSPASTSTSNQREKGRVRMSRRVLWPV
jgi:hypothetical protein